MAPVPLEWKEHHYRKAEEKINSLIEVLHPIREQGGQSIVFVQSRRRSEQVAQALKESGFQVSHHHAGLNQEIAEAQKTHLEIKISKPLLQQEHLKWG